MIKLHYNVADALDECIHKLDVESRREVVFRQRHPRSILFVQEGKKPPQQALTFSPMRRNHSTPESSKESKLKGADSTSSSHTESDDEDEFEREWVTKGAFRK